MQGTREAGDIFSLQSPLSCSLLLRIYQQQSRCQQAAGAEAAVARGTGERAWGGLASRGLAPQGQAGARAVFVGSWDPGRSHRAGGRMEPAPTSCLHDGNPHRLQTTTTPPEARLQQPVPRSPAWSRGPATRAGLPGLSSLSPAPAPLHCTSFGPKLLGRPEWAPGVALSRARAGSRIHNPKQIVAHSLPPAGAAASWSRAGDCLGHRGPKPCSSGAQPRPLPLGRSEPVAGGGGRGAPCVVRRVVDRSQGDAAQSLSSRQALGEDSPHQRHLAQMKPHRPSPGPAPALQGTLAPPKLTKPEKRWLTIAFLLP